MNSLRHIIIFTLSSFSVIACAQTKYGIKHIYSFCRERNPGIIAVDKNGNPLDSPPDTINTVYLEVSGQPVQWISAWKDGKTYSVSMSQVNETPYIVGRIKEGDENIILTPSKGNTLWRIDLLPAAPITGAPKKIKPGEILLQGKYGKEVIIQKIERPVMLHSIPSV